MIPQPTAWPISDVEGLGPEFRAMVNHTAERWRLALPSLVDMGYPVEEFDKMEFALWTRPVFCKTKKGVAAERRWDLWKQWMQLCGWHTVHLEMGEERKGPTDEEDGRSTSAGKSDGRSEMARVQKNTIAPVREEGVECTLGRNRV